MGYFYSSEIKTGTYVRSRIVANEYNISTANNSSDLQVWLEMRRTNTGYTTSGKTEWDFTVTGFNAQHDAQNVSISGTNWVRVSGIKTFAGIKHDTNGNKTVGITVKTTSYSGISNLNTPQTTWNIALTHIELNRASTIKSLTGASEINGSNKIKVTLNSAKGSNRHKVRWELGSYNYTVSGAGTDTEYAIPMSWINALPNSYTGQVDVTVTTYSNAACTAQVGEAVKAKFAVTVPEVCRPTIGSVSAEIVNENQTLKNLGIAVYGFTRARVKMSGITASYSSPIDKYSVTGAGQSGSGADWTSGLIMQSGAVTFNCKITDKRGRTAEKTTNSITVLQYMRPSITLVSVERCGADGEPSSTGEYMKVSAAADISSLNGNNSLTLSVRWKKSTEGSFTNTRTLTNGEAALIPDIERVASYDVEITARDILTSTTAYRVVPSEKVAFHAGENGGVGLMTYADENGTAKINGKLKLNQGDGNNYSTMESFVTESGTSGIWRYRKWSDGTAECWGNYTDRSLTPEKVASGVSVCAGATFNLPSNLFISGQTPTGTVSSWTPSWAMVGFYTLDENKVRMGWVIPNGSTNTFSNTAFIHIIGRWK